MGAKKRVRESNTSAAPTSQVTTKAELISMRPPPPPAKERVDPRINRKREHADSLDDFELSMLQSGFSIVELADGAKKFNAGTRTPYVRLCNAVIRWWIRLPMGQKRVLWVDPKSGFTEKNAPKFSSSRGAELVARGLAGFRWVYSRAHLLEAREWREHMLQMTPAERLREDPVPGQEHFEAK